MLDQEAIDYICKSFLKPFICLDAPQCYKGDIWDLLTLPIAYRELSSQSNVQVYITGNLPNAIGCNAYSLKDRLILVLRRWPQKAHQPANKGAHMQWSRGLLKVVYKVSAESRLLAYQTCTQRIWLIADQDETIITFWHIRAWNTNERSKINTCRAE